MIKIEREINSGFEIFSINNDTGNLKIFYYYGLDLCWTCNPKDNSDSDTCDIVISPCDSYIYTLIDEVYDSIFNNQPFKYLKYDFAAKDLVFPEKIDNTKRLFKDGIIEWHSDDYVYNVGSVVYIKKEEDKYIITIQKNKKCLEGKYPFNGYTVTFGNNSRYNPYNVTFMNMFNKLRDHDFFVNQVNINNYSSEDKTRVRKK